SDGVNLYGARATGAAPGTKSIWNSTCRVDVIQESLLERLPESHVHLKTLQTQAQESIHFGRRIQEK
ncbi:hypothetical protein Tco_0028374, partial [Tanacetum coccineum]